MELDLMGRLERSAAELAPAFSPAATEECGVELSLGRSSGEVGPRKKAKMKEEGTVPYGLQVMPVILQGPDGYGYACMVPFWVPCSADVVEDGVCKEGGDRDLAVEIDGGACQVEVAGGSRSPESSGSETSVLRSFSAKGESSSTNESRSHSSSATIHNNPSPISKFRNWKSGLKKPPTHIKGRKKTALSRKCTNLVSTRSAERKKIDGYLYECSEKEVRILCDCHGSIFSPAGFVRHAGGPETQHPLRQITVVTA